MAFEVMLPEGGKGHAVMGSVAAFNAEFLCVQSGRTITLLYRVTGLLHYFLTNWTFTTKRTFA